MDDEGKRQGLTPLLYTYDASGQRTQKALGGAAVRETPFTATYDEANRLTALTLNGEAYTLAYLAARNGVRPCLLPPLGINCRHGPPATHRFPGAAYHVTARGDWREPIFVDDEGKRQGLTPLLQRSCNEGKRQGLTPFLQGLTPLLRLRRSRQYSPGDRGCGRCAGARNHLDFTESDPPRRDQADADQRHRPIPDGVETRNVYLYYFFREGGANPTQPIPVTMANDIDALPGEQVTLWYYDESPTPDANSNQWRVMGLGTVSADGKTIVSNPGVGIPIFCCGASFPQRGAGANTGGNAGNGCGPSSPNPVDLGSGNALVFTPRPFGISKLMSVDPIESRINNCQRHDG